MTCAELSGMIAKDERQVWELYRKRPVKHGLRASHYFDMETHYGLRLESRYT